MRLPSPALPLAIVLFASCLAFAAEPAKLDTRRGDAMIAEYFRDETAKLSDPCLDDVQSLEDWKAKRETYRQQLLEMLGLDPLPEKTDLKAEVTGRVEEEEFIVENLHYQSRPGLYVTGNLYLPKKIDKPAPAVLYVCGHGQVKKDGVSYGNKTHYHHHGSWFARNGYVCLTIDSHQLGEIEGIHHGTHRYNMWWWLSRGYTPAGVEAWNCVRALDYLQSRPEVDGERLGVTGRSGGGAYSWWIAAIDDRIKAAVPVAGITDLQNHVVDGCVEGHCDCMFTVNTYRWDYPLLAALIAPRPLLISNTDSDGIFPLDGVTRTFFKVRKIYDLHGAKDKFALNITAGGHKDTQELQVHCFRWLNHHLKQDDSLIEDTAVKFFQPEQLKVFKELPDDRVNEKIQETFVATAPTPEVAKSKEEWESHRDAWKEALKEKSFRAWPAQADPLDMKQAFETESQGIRLTAYDFTSQGAIRLRLYVAHSARLNQPKLTVLDVLDEKSWAEFLATMRVAFEDQLRDETLPNKDEKSFEQLSQMFAHQPWAFAYAAPRGIGPTAWDQSEKKQTQHKRRFYLLGQTLDGMRVWDVRRAINAVREIDSLKSSPLWLQSQDHMAGVTLYASLYEPDITRLDLYQLPKSHREGPDLLNVQRYLDMPQALAMAMERSQVVVYDEEKEGWEFAQQTAKSLSWEEKQLRLRSMPETDAAGK